MSTGVWKCFRRQREQDSLAAVLQVCFDNVVVGVVEGGAVLEQRLVNAVHVHTGNCGQLRLHCWGERERKKSPLLAHPERLTDHLTAKHEYKKVQPHLLPTLSHEEFKAANSTSQSRFPLHTLGSCTTDLGGISLCLPSKHPVFGMQNS